MQIFHDKTEITLKNSFEQTSFIDWRTQPKNHKKYPDFFRRYKIDEFDELKFIKNFGKITDIKKYGKEEVSLRTNPSAGGLYPCEVYIQIRGVKGFLSGIYHYEPLENNLVLIHELSNDGLEYYLQKNQQYKFVTLISNVYFRSSWKYEKRAIRYLLLDTGHQIGSIYSALKLENIDCKLEFEFDKNLINESFGFEGFEFFQVAILSEFYKEKEIKPLREKLVNVSACDYQIRNSFIDGFINHLEHESFPFTMHFDFLEELEKKNLEEAINKRRSIRAFKEESITKNEFNLIIKDIFEYSNCFGIDIYIIVNNIKDLKSGIYKNVTLLEEGDFRELSKKLAFNQKLGGSSCFTLFFTSRLDSNYIQNYILCGFLAHIISIRAINLEISSSGIGAYFDDECKKTFNTQNNILYLQAIGK
jgi:SagB-type dehydrogenase family enzyme